MKFQRAVTEEILELLKKPLPIFQVLVGPRQGGKTTIVQNIIQKLGWPSHYANADTVLPPSFEWIENQWKIAKLKAEQSKHPVILVLDEVQKIQGWGHALKRLWELEKNSGTIKLIILGSSAWPLQREITENITNQFFFYELAHWSLLPHWSFKECKEAFGWNFNQWLYFGGYPEAASWIGQEDVWKKHIVHSLLETVIARDLVQTEMIYKPTLLRHLFVLAAQYPGQIFSYNRMLVQLQDVGNTITLAYYMKVLENAFLISGVDNFFKDKTRKRGSSPKIIVWNNALVNALSSYSFQDMLENPDWYSYLIKNAIGAHLLNYLPSIDWDIHYWKHRNEEIEFIVCKNRAIYALDVKLNYTGRTSKLEKFKRNFPRSKILSIGIGGMDLETFFLTSPLELFN